MASIPCPSNALSTVADCDGDCGDEKYAVKVVKRDVRDR